MKLKKIAIITPSAGGGGAEKASTLLSIILNNLNYDVHFIAAYPKKDYKVEGVFYCLNISKTSSLNKLQQVSGFFKLRKYIKHHDFDFIVDFRSRRLFLTELLFECFVVPKSCKMIYTFHLPLLSKYIPKPWTVFKSAYNKSKKVICVSKGIEKKANAIGLNNTQVILNPIDFDFIENQLNDDKLYNFKFIVGVGRMDDNIKQFDHLMDCYSKSSLPKKNIHLVILGKGNYQTILENYRKALPNHEKIHFAGFHKNPYKFMSEAKFFVLSSQFEGYPLVVLEALACGTPVVSYNCPTGPSEIIKNKENGILVPPQDKEKLKEALNEFVDNHSLYNYCKSNARKSVEHLTMKKIGEQWKQLIEGA